MEVFQRFFMTRLSLRQVQISLLNCLFIKMSKYLNSMYFDSLLCAQHNKLQRINLNVLLAILSFRIPTRVQVKHQLIYWTSEPDWQDSREAFEHAPLASKWYSSSLQKQTIKCEREENKLKVDNGMSKGEDYLRVLSSFSCCCCCSCCFLI